MIKSQLMHIKGNCKQGKKTTLRMEENSFKWSNWRRSNLQNIQAAHAAQYQKTSQWKNGQWTNIAPKKTFRWPTNTWKDAQHHYLLEKCKSKPQWGITIHQSEWSSSKSLQTINAREEMEKREPSCSVAGNVNWYSYSGKQYGGSLKN